MHLIGAVQKIQSTLYFAGIYIGSKITPAAVKLLKDNSQNFEWEIHPLFKIQHPNLVSLIVIGYCNESGHKILVYEYTAKGCLSRYLKKGSRISFSWLERLNVCLGAARGLQHLHTGTDEFAKGIIIHREVNPGNILVGENWVGKLSDFEMFKLSIADQAKTLKDTNLKDTYGYYAPEYMMLGRVTRKTDVYAFGVVLFQVLCWKLPRDREDESYYADEGRRPSMNDVVLNIQKAIEWQEYENLAKQLEDKDAGKMVKGAKMIS